jgi:hypothetical protein
MDIFTDWAVVGGLDVCLILVREKTILKGEENQKLSVALPTFLSLLWEEQE